MLLLLAYYVRMYVLVQKGCLLDLNIFSHVVIMTDEIHNQELRRYFYIVVILNIFIS